jgi:hypothetical protein
MGPHLLEPIKGGASTPDPHWLSKWYRDARDAIASRKLVFIVCLGVAAWVTVFGNSTSNGAVSEPTKRYSQKVATQRPLTNAPSAVETDGSEAAFPERRSATVQNLDHTPSTLTLHSREGLLESPRSNLQEPNLFASKSWAPPRLPPAPTVVSSPPLPSAPRFPYTYIGKKFEDSVWEVYLARGDQTFIVRPQTLIEGSYRVESIKPPLVTLTYLPLNLMQTLMIEGVD